MRRLPAHLGLWLVLTLMVCSNVYLIFLLAADQSAEADKVISYISGAALPTILFAFDQIRRRRLELFLFTQRIVALFSVRTPSWHVSANFKGEGITTSTLDDIVTRLIERKPSGTIIKVRRKSEDEIDVIVDPSATLEISIDRPTGRRILNDELDSNTSIHVVIRNYKVDYRKATNALKNEIMPLLEEVARSIDKVDARYSLVIHYDKNSNPFYSLYIAHLDPTIVSSFSVQLQISENESVSISESHLAVNARSQSAFQNLALDFLTFRMRVGEHLA